MGEPKNKIALSYSSIATFLSCRHKYFYKYIKGYTPRTFESKYIVGNFFSLGLFYFYTQKKDPIESVMKMFEIEKQNMRKKLILSPTDEQSLYEQDVIIRGMLEAYKIKYKEFIKTTKHGGNEVPLEHVSSNGVKFMGKLDNLLIRDGKKYIHEIKTSKYLDENYVKNIKNSLQIAIYYTLYNELHEDKIEGIIYDVTKKPSIRLKQNETKSDYLDRLNSYYFDKTKADLFYMEIIKKPLISSKKVFNLIDRILDDIKKCKTEEDYYHNFQQCFVWNRCEYYDVCFFGENKNNLAMFDIRQNADKESKNERKVTN